MEVILEVILLKKISKEETLRIYSIENRTCKRLKIRFPRQSMARAQTLFSSVALDV